MNKRIKNILCLALLASITHFCGATTSKIIPRSQSFNAARQIVGWNNPEWGINRMPQDDDYYSFNIIFEYTRTFRDSHIARCLFGDDLVCGQCDDLAFSISGSDVAARASTDWLADYFGLPRDFQSTVTVKPTISNFILDFSFYAGLDAWAQGMYFKIYGPFVHTKWNLKAEECIAQAGTVGYFQGYFSSVAVPVENLNSSFLSYANGSVPTIPNDYDLYGEYGCIISGSCSPLGDITWQSLCCSRINNECDCDSTLTRNGFGELRFILGYNFCNDEQGDYHLGLGIYGAAPTGTRVGEQDGCNNKGRYLFEPIVGNGHHWELGAQVTAHYIGWRNEDEDKSFGMYLEANVTHLFSTSQIRCFDLCSAGSNSRYMLAERLQSDRNTTVLSTPPLSGDSNPFGLEFANEYAPVANITRRNVTSHIAAQGDFAVTLSYQSGNFQWDLGYDFWGRSCEKLCIENNCCAPVVGDWALKGDQRVYGFKPGMATALATPLPVTDSGATIHAGSNMLNGVSYIGINPQSPVNFYADNSVLATSIILTHPAIGAIQALPMYISQDPVFIQESDFDTRGTRGISNKLFTHFNWARPDYCNTGWSPYIGVGAEVEFGSNDHGDCCNTSCATTCATPACDTLRPCCENCAISQWGVWFKVGTSYN